MGGPHWWSESDGVGFELTRVVSPFVNWPDLKDLKGSMQSGCYRIVSKRGADVSPPFPLGPI